jgi:hypothetical protein
MMILTEAQKKWLISAERGISYSFENDFAGWRDIGRPLKDMRLVQWVANPRVTAVVLTPTGAVMREELKAISEGQQMTPEDMRMETETFVRHCVAGIESTESEVARASKAAFEALTWHIPAFRLSGFAGSSDSDTRRGPKASPDPTTPSPQ